MPIYVPGYDEMPTSDQVHFRHALHRFLFEGCLQWALPGDRLDYELLLQNRGALADLLEVFEINPIIEEKLGVMYFEPIGDPEALEEIATRDELMLLALLRAELELQRQQTGAAIGETTVNALYTRYRVELGKVATKLRFQDALRRFKKLKIIQVVGKLDAGDSAIRILPVLLRVTPTHIENLAEKIREETGTGEAPEADELAEAVD